jgi:membrane protein DedA with SNARE-associated domain
MMGRAVLPFLADHLMHAATFSTLTFLGALLWAPLAVFAGIMVGAGGLPEVIRAPVGRDMSLGDWTASSMGVAICALSFLSVAVGAAVLRRS